jgi:hypothetical protein
MEKVIRIYDIAQPEAAPVMLPQAAAGIRNLAWLQNDNLLLAALSDKAGIKCVGCDALDSGTGESYAR